MLNTDKYKIKLNQLVGANDNYIKVSLKNDGFDFVDYSEDNTDLLTSSKEENVNPFDDGEKKMFRPIEGDYTFTFNFLDNNYWNRYTFTKFDLTEDILNLSESFINSFYVVQVYDTFNSKNQILLSTGYYNVFNFAKIANQTNNNISTHIINSSSEALQIYLPLDYINSFTGNTFDIYIRYFFYNAKSGAFIPFYNKGATNLPSPTTPTILVNNETDIYLKVNVNKSTRKYDLSAMSLYFNQFNNPEYNNLINSTVESIPLEKPTYPSGTSFTSNGNYETLSI